MKKILPILAAFLLLTGCQIKNYTPEIPSAFVEEAVVTSGDFSYDCKICKTDSNVSVTVLSTNAKGMTMTYDGTNLKFDYSGFSYDIDGGNFEKTNTAILVYEMFKYINTAEALDAKKIDGGFKYSGKISAGDFILIQNDDGSFKSAVFRQWGIAIEFKS